MQKIFYSIIGQTLAITIISILGYCIFQDNIPGNAANCDAGELFEVLLKMGFLLISTAFMGNAIIFYILNSWKKFRIAAILANIILITLVFTINGIIIKFKYGKVNQTFSIHSEVSSAQINLYQNGRFIVYAYDGNCRSENIGTYTLTNNTLSLKYEHKKALFLNTIYHINHNQLVVNG